MDVKCSEELKSFQVLGEDIYTKDTFKCGICKEEKLTIDDYVTHMLEEEKCIMVMESSSCLKDLQLPKFKRNASLQKCEETGMENQLKMNSSKAVEIEIGQGVRRWKCKVCCLTFSRLAAVLNHFKLAEHPFPEKISSNEINITKTVKKECKEICFPILENTGVNNFPVDQKDDVNNLVLNALKTPNSQPICHICGQIFKSESIVASHIKIVHSERRPFVCKMGSCTLGFKTKGSLIRHVRRHTGDRPYKCQLCGRAYGESGSLLRHQQSKIPCNNKPDSHLPRYGITLPFANGVKADSEVECKVPLKKERTEELEEVILSTADGELQEAEETKAKVRKEILNKNQDFTQLNGLFGTQEKKPPLKDMKKELLSFDSDDEKETKKMDDPLTEDSEDSILRRCFMCPVCYKSYSSMTFLSTHMKKHLAELGKECSSCKKRFTSNHALSRHLLTHSSARQFECRQCRKTFKLKSHALAHLKSHSSIRSVPCAECGRLFKSVSSRNTHMKIHKGERNFECTVCFKKFLVKASFLRHLRVHTKDRPFRCPYCNEGFKEHGTLKRHIRFKLPCSQFHTDSKNDLILGEFETKSSVKEDIEGRVETRMEALSEINDFSEVDSELESYFSEKLDLPFTTQEYLLPHFDNFETLPTITIKQEVVKKDLSDCVS